MTTSRIPLERLTSANGAEPASTGGLSERHRKALEDDSAISPDVIAERGYRTAIKRSQLRRLFPEWQRRAPALWIPTHSPDGVTTSAQIRPDTPRKDGKGKPIKYESPGSGRCILDVHPRNMAAVKDASVPLWITEGVKKGDALTTHGACAISLTGVWNWMRREEGALPCWGHVALKGRTVYVAFDSDVLLKPGVQLALERLTQMLESREAHVMVTYLPGGEGAAKTGVDDYLASGGSVAKLKALSRQFGHEDLRRLRLARAPSLKQRLEQLWATWRKMPATKRAKCTERSVFKAFLPLAERYGQSAADGVSVEASERTLAESAACGRSSVNRAVQRLEEDGYIRIDKENRQRDKATRYTLLTVPPGEEGGAIAGHNGEEGAGEEETFPSLYPCGPEMRAPQNTEFYRTSDPGGPEMRGVGELRWSTVMRYSEQDGDGQRVYVHEYLARLGKKRQAILDYLLWCGGTATVSELVGEFGTSAERRRPRDFVRRQLAPLTDPAVITIDGPDVNLTVEWRRALEEHRSLGGEPEAAERQRERHRRQRQAFRQRDMVRPEPVPDSPQVDDLSKPWTFHPEGCACRECEGRFGKVIGEHVEGCCCGECRARRRGETLHPRRRHLYAVPEDFPEDWRNHPIDCECPDCTSPAPTYARPAGAV